MSNTTEKQVVDLIKRSSKVLIMPSSPPDGDSIGSAIALYLALKKLQKEVTVVCYEDVPEVLTFLPNTKIVGDKMSSSKDFVITLDSKARIESIKTEQEGNKINIIITPAEGSVKEQEINFNKGKVEYDLIITVDCAELTQLGDLYENNIELFHQVPVINIDHHVSNAHFGKINYVDIMSSSTTELLFPILEELAKEEGVDIIDEDIATLLLTGIITDTGSFQNANTSPKSFAKAAQLISHGARQQEIIQHIYKTKQLSQLKLWGRVLTKIQTDEKYRMVWSVVSQQDFKDTESSEEQTGDIIDELMTNAPGAEIVFLMKEKEDGQVSISMRTTTPSVDASYIAEQFGGGGHTQAAGFRITDKNLRDAEYEVIKKVQEYQKDRLNIHEEEKKDEKAPLINIEELMQRAKEAELATSIMKKAEPKEEKIVNKSTKKITKKKTTKNSEAPKKKAFNPKAPPVEDHDKKAKDTSGSGYKFES
ncbi:bifunctional oligoribonuclease/PAP phosphatase NrnA [Candidatus Peregrinibacteria bacterium]|jgi:bifunctional oligoribonuclease and PAP phosphatase NrnA|nr:bifunctional oligoribonuclease/PAP phosphatase NrnA [Candidatus Peregrinibacteria bacterium]MBT7736201.1 bifunctional oligoribonuclease/PAP phosphatase NrnA [Candidatus Peregrinibacteria bacterium]